MKRLSRLFAMLGVCLLIILFASSTHAFDRLNWRSTSVTVAENGTYSGSFEVPSDTIAVKVLIPDIDAGAVGIEFTNDAGSNYYPVLDPLSGTDAVICASGSDPGLVDISGFCSFMHNDGAATDLYVYRFSCASQTSGAVTIYIYFGG